MGDTAVAEEAAISAEHLSSAEIAAAVDSLSADDRLRLATIGQVFSGGTDMSAKDLVHEALCRAMTGERHCPRNTPFMAFVVKTMQSIAYHARQKQRLHDQLSPNSAEIETASISTAPETQQAYPTPEDLIIEQQSLSIVEAMQSHFDGDEQAQLVLLGWANDLKGKTLREFVTVDQAELDYIVKRIRRKMIKLYPNGWMS